MQKNTPKILPIQKKALPLHAFSLKEEVPRDVKLSFADRK